MPGIYKVVEIAGTSTVSFSDAVKNAIAEASRTLRNLDWFEVVEERGRIVKDQIEEFQVVLKIGFKLERQ